MPQPLPKRKGKHTSKQKTKTPKPIDPNREYSNDPSDWRPGELPFPSD